MIDFQITPRSSGKTTELISLYKENPGMFFTLGRNSKLKPQFYTHFNPNLFRGLKNSWFYFDDFSHQTWLPYEDLILLDSYENNIVVRSTLGVQKPTKSSFCI